jgi:hypothetical protein
MNEAQKENATLAGGVEMEVMLRNGAKETVVVRELPVREFPKLGEAITDEEKQVEIYCDKPAGWAATLRAKSHHAIMQTGDELNKEAFFGWYVRKVDLAKQERKVMPELAKLAAASASPTGSPKSPTSPA